MTYSRGHTKVSQNTSPPVVLFLDFDGVVQTPALDDWQEMEHCEGLRALLASIPELEVVITSTHREGRNLPTLRALLPQDIAPRVVGATPVTALGRADGGRQAEIEAWLQERAAAATWAAVDDERHLYAPDCPGLVLTNKYVGWTSQTTEDLFRMLCQGRAHVPTSTGTLEAPSLESASHRCLPSTKTSSLPAGASTGNAGQSLRRPAAAPRNHSSKYASREWSGAQGVGFWDAARRFTTSIKTTWTGLFTSR